MRRLCIALVLACCSLSNAQSVRLPEKVDLKAFRLTEPPIAVEWEGDDATVVSGSPEVVAFREYHPNPKLFLLRIVGYTKGTYNVSVVVGKTVDGKTVLAKGTMVVNIEGGTVPTPVDPVVPDPPVDPDPVNPDDPDFPGEIDANFLRVVKAAAGTWPKAELKKLAKVHVLVADILKNSKNTKVKQVHSLAASNIRDSVSEIPETLAAALGGELNKVLPRDAEHTLTDAEVKTIRKKLLSFARTLHSAGR